MATPGAMLLQKHPGRIPVVCRPHDGMPMRRTKFLVDGNSHVSEFMGVIRNNVELKRHEAMYLFVNNTLVPNSHTFFRVYEEHKDRIDDILYVHVRKEATFG